MTNFENLVRGLVIPLVMFEESVSVTSNTLEDGTVEINVLVHSDDIGRVIGKGGKIATAIRTICYAGATKEGIRVRVNIDAKE